MVKQRLIFTLLYNNGNFVLSRNFRLQRVGNLRWLQKNYDFSKISFSIDELVVLDVTRSERNIEAFCQALQKLTEGCFVPIAAGGGITTMEHAQALFRSGADKIVVNTHVHEDSGLISEIAKDYGQQSLIASMDVKKASDGQYAVHVESGERPLDGAVTTWIDKALQAPVGELYLNSMVQDGTGQGYDLAMLDHLPEKVEKPIILAGGAGNSSHLAEGLADPRVDAVATAHLFNFVGDGLKKARLSLIDGGVDIPTWDVGLLENRATISVADA
ncbi:HisA/HisF-related TIM barrel protein [Cohaesibacter gelatinilyticus]|uniref:Imidazole glycerol phosphate synthase subunit HisF n=1 Tax=Cohaesibacter gelatinilyticus TaxID=372072 RepID=A0A285PJS6_9HYPH|nr:HisA/HisF-related TIM barrel protein [Cohaesibacter gelatinilyticus]SNZ20131.1 cyclase [Cohaesibacter gelatinilyticus]